jgi:DNA-binding NarL/FixJ family response regulator
MSTQANHIGTGSGAASSAATRQAGSAKIGVLIVDDHPMVRRGIAELVRREPDLTVCGEASTMQEAMALAQKLKPGLMIVDVSLEGNNGLELMKNMEGRISTPILAYSMHDETIYAERCLHAGARGYLMKQAPPEALLEAIRQVLGGKTYLSVPMSDRLLGKFVGSSKSKTPITSPIDSLSDRELEVLQLIGNGQTTAQIADRLCLSVKTVETYREHLKQKLNLADGQKLMRYAIEWSLNAPPPAPSRRGAR